MSTKPDVWFPLVVGDYLKDTMGLTTEQHGAYLLLLMEYWVKGPLPDNDVALAQMTRMSARRWAATRPVLLAYFRLEGGQWRNKRSDEERERWAERKRKFTERAAAGGRGKAASSTSQAVLTGVLTGCTASASGEVEGPDRPSTLSGQARIFDLKGQERLSRPPQTLSERIAYINGGKR